MALRKWRKKKVIVKKLISIENFGGMDILCVDKTGTLTKGEVKMHSCIDFEGKNFDKAALFATLNAAFQTGYTNPIDSAIMQRAKEQNLIAWKKLDEVPYDFVRKRLSIVAKNKHGICIISKGAFRNILSCCTTAELANGKIVNLQDALPEINKLFEKICNDGFRALAIAYKPTEQDLMHKEDEKEMIFLGFILFFDPPKEKMLETLTKLQNQGIGLKIISGDHHLVVANLAKRLGLPEKVITGKELQDMSNRALFKQVKDKSAFAEIEPPQKERIILALKKWGHTVGFMGDGINDTTALHAADVGISVNTAADVVKDVADIVMLDKDLSVLSEGIEEGRKTFMNTLKYIFMATSANFGNMFSMAGISLFINFLPLLPKQILLTNLLTDFPEMTIATDNIDQEAIAKPLRWNIKFIRRFMVVFGLISSIFDYVTFLILLFLLKADVAQFRTGWFLESIISASTIVLAIRTFRSIFKSRPSIYLTTAILSIVIVTLSLPFTPLASIFELTPLPLGFLAAIGGIMLCYFAFVEIAKKLFFHMHNKRVNVHLG